MRIPESLKYFLTVLFAVSCLFILFPNHLQAADKPATITSCKLNSKGSKVTVKVKIRTKDSSYGKKFYLLALDGQASETKAIKASPLASTTNKKGTVTFKVKYKEPMLYQKFALAYKTNGKYKVISNTYYITNPEVFATYTGSGPKTTSKKGLQVENLDEAIELRTQHAVINWTVNSLMTTDCTNTLPYKYRGKTYYFNADMLDYNDAQVQAYNAAGAKVTIILLLPNSANSQTDTMRYKGSSYAKYSSFNVSTQKGCRTFEALMSYLAKRYGTKENYVSGWILGNEVNNQGEWNYGGNKKISSYMDNYTRAFRICYNAVKSVSKKSNVYISLDYNWNCDPDVSGKRYFTTKTTLDEFYRQINERGKIVFHIAYHAYPQGLVNPVFWDDALATNSVDSTFITFRNLNVLTNYVKKNFGKSYTIMLSEQSFNSTKGEAVQAAAYAYAYYLSESNSMIESFIYGRQFDHPVEMADNCYWGLCDNTRTKRIVWHVFQNIDTAASFKFTNQLVKYTDLKSWSKISGFKKSKYEKMPKINRKPTLGTVSMEGTNTSILFWKKVDYVDGYEIYRNDKKIATIMDPSVLGYKDNELTAGETYTYKIRSFKFIPNKTNANEKGAIFSSYSNAMQLTATTGKAAWKNNNCTVTGKNISLSWETQKGVTGYEVVRSTSSNGAYAPITDTAKTSFTDKDTVTGTTYYYKVRAYVTKNGQNYYGEYSDEISLQANIKLAAKVIDGELVLSWTAFPNATKYQIYCSSDSNETFVKIKTTGNADTLTYACVNYKTDDGTQSFNVGETYHFKVRAMLNGVDRSPYSNVVDVTIEEELTSSEAAMQSEEMEASQAMELEVTETEVPETETTETETTETETETTENSETEETETSETETTETEETETGSTENTETENFEAENDAVESTETENTETREVELETAWTKPSTPETENK
ncbi:MAG: DUF5722 domain-containing protein [Clostridiales bacterium]|nr:DUF5722 domain-containing protein [Clostridiales bacterium]